MTGAIVHPDVPELRVQGEGSWRRRHGRDLPQWLGGCVSVHGFASFRGALRLRDGPPRIGKDGWCCSGVAAEHKVPPP